MAEPENPIPSPFPPELLSALLAAVLNSQSTANLPPSIYFNGFSIGTSWSDVGITLLLNGQHIASLSMSFTTGKTLAEELTKTIALFERQTQHEIMTMDVVRDKTEPNT